MSRRAHWNTEKIKETGKEGIMKAILDYLAIKSYPSVRMNSGMMRKVDKNKTGEVVERFIRFYIINYPKHYPISLVDIFGMKPIKPISVFFAIEVKGENGKLTEGQRNCIKLVNDLGHIGIVARSITDVQFRLG